jgi:hypothetical protein
MQVAQTILAQLGGQRFVVMTGASNLVSDSERERGSLTLKVGRNDKGVTHVRVTLTDADLYRVETLKVRAGKVATLDTANDVFADQLRAAFEGMTGLRTSL